MRPAFHRLVLLLLSGLPLAAMPVRSAIAASVPVSRPARSDLYAAFIAEASQRFGLPAGWIRAVMGAESANDPAAVSPKGAMGLMQLMPTTWGHLRARHSLGGDPHDPRDNILAGAAYLRELHDRYGSPGFLIAYNAGPGRYEDHLRGRPLPAETRAYVAALAPIIDGGEMAGPVGVASADPPDWTRAPLFVAQPRLDVSTAAPQSASLFVVRSEAGGRP